MIEFKSVDPGEAQLYESYLWSGDERGCEYSFANLYLWGNQRMAALHDHIVLFSQFGGRSVYPYPIGNGDKKKVLDAIIDDSEKRQIPLWITGMSAIEKETLEELYPGIFQFQYDAGTFDYVYDIDNLADLKGRKYQSKRNHCNRFRGNFPSYIVEQINENNMTRVRQMVEKWYAVRLQENPEGDYQMEQTAITKAFCHYNELNMEGLVLLDGDEVLAVTMGSRMLTDTFDVHFEKARHDIDGAYAVINCEFARYIRSKYPQIRFLNREEDMGLEGLRKSKESYHPHHRVEKYRACRKENKNVY